MISAQSKQGIDYIFCQAVKKSLTLDPGDFSDVEPLPHGNESFNADEIYVLTISSLLFKVVTIFHVSDDLPSRNYFINNAHDKSFEEVFSELSNLCSGSMNQELLRYFPHLGMSTPYKLSGRCLPYLKELNAGYQSRHLITINGFVRLHATVCLCAYAPVNFTVDRSIVADTSGELEFF